jgi:hypothetical protein
VKKAVYGMDPTGAETLPRPGGRCSFDPNALSLRISDGNEKYHLVKRGEITADLALAKKAMQWEACCFDSISVPGRSQPMGLRSHRTVLESTEVTT